MSGYQESEAAASREDDPNIPFASFSSPPCFLHEIAPSFLAPLSRNEILRLLEELLAVGWARTYLEQAWLNAMLRRHIEHLAARKISWPAGAATLRDEPTPAALRKLARDLQDALPRIQDQVLRRDLQDVSASLVHFLRRHGAAAREEH